MPLKGPKEDVEEATVSPAAAKEIRIGAAAVAVWSGSDWSFGTEGFDRQVVVLVLLTGCLSRSSDTHLKSPPALIYKPSKPPFTNACLSIQPSNAPDWNQTKLHGNYPKKKNNNLCAVGTCGSLKQWLGGFGLSTYFNLNSTIHLQLRLLLMCVAQSNRQEKIYSIHIDVGYLQALVSLCSSRRRWGGFLMEKMKILINAPRLRVSQGIKTRRGRFPVWPVTSIHPRRCVFQIRADIYRAQ